MSWKALMSGGAAPRGPLPAMVSHGLVACLLVGLVVTAALWFGSGEAAALNAAAATLVVALVFVTGVLALAAVLGTGDARSTSAVAMLGAFVVYFGQLIALTALALALHDQPWIDRLGVAVGGLSAVVAWQAGQLLGFARSRVLVFTPGLGGGVR